MNCRSPKHPQRVIAETRRAFMKILLQHSRTQLYLRGLGDWTPDANQAYDFGHSQRAIDFAREHYIAGAQIAVKFVDPEFDEVIPLPAVAPPQPDRRTHN